MLEEGFYHSLGHGVGLELHEAPMLGRNGEELVAGDVIAVEPGGYRLGLRRLPARGAACSSPRTAARCSRSFPHDLVV